MQTAQTPRKQGMKTRYLCERLPFMLLKLTLVCMRSISRPRSTPVRPEGTLCTEALHWMGSTELSQATHHTLCTTTGADLGARQKKQGYESNPETQTLFFLLAAVTCPPPRSPQPQLPPGMDQTPRGHTAHEGGSQGDEGCKAHQHPADHTEQRIHMICGFSRPGNQAYGNLQYN